MIGMRIDAYDGASAATQVGIVHAVYASQYPPGTPIDEWREGIWSAHRSREGFDLLIAREGDEVAGLVWGYVGERGQFWTDLAAASLAEDVADAWLGGHFEVVELIVLPAYRRRGLGAALLARILERSDRPRALLSVADTNVPARALYASMGWVVLGPLGARSSVMGIAPCLEAGPI
ncbi:GNAT family N-acetyltransferase [Microbacterium flavum]|uniref:GNAT family N-acetyltransferase n=1 Tax=Microbacterium flavum TaxID=415216 RepID=A0ABS5XQ36_9MICO|nr:GNAT family N-acetyltransferase [Microbacterium flavum]MBT8796639.1 GNAT family N-acetyltransferase [Microbacterium flavum]